MAFHHCSLHVDKSILAATVVSVLKPIEPNYHEWSTKLAVVLLFHLADATLAFPPSISDTASVLQIHYVQSLLNFL